MRVLVVVVTYNGMSWYDRCFSSLSSSTLPIDVVAIDNASTDGSADYIAQHFPWVRLVPQAENLGFGRANNLALSYALEHQYDYVFLLNQDAWLNTADSLEQLVAVAAEHPEYLIISPMQLYAAADRVNITSSVDYLSCLKRNNDLFSDAILHQPLKPVYQVRYVCAASWLLSRQTLLTIGGFDPLFFHRGEDDNYMQRVRYHNGLIGICPSSTVCHDTEYRTADYDSVHNNWEKNMLIDIADPNSTKSVADWISEYRTRAVGQLLKFKWTKASDNFKVANYIKKHKAEIQYSINQNKLTKANWL